MTQYRITKYNPKLRDDQGSYIDRSEWTAISDIGKIEYNNVTYEEYEKTETAYVKSILVIINEKKIKSLKINSLHIINLNENIKNNYRFKNLILDFDSDARYLKEDMEIEFDKLDKIIRLILREVIHAVLIGDNIEIKFGYDYYMYVNCEKLKSSTIEFIEKAGLFVEPGTGPIEYSFLYSNE